MSEPLLSIKDQINSYKGKRVHCRVSKGRKRVEEAEGIVLEVYPKLFTMYDESKDATVSFSYAAILTRDVVLELIQ